MKGEAGSRKRDIGDDPIAEGLPDEEDAPRSEREAEEDVLEEERGES